MGTAPARLEPDRQRIRELARCELAALNERTRASEAMFRRLSRVLPGGVPSSFQLRDPWPVYMSHGDGSRAWDADGNEYVDFHNGIGAMVQGHAHPAISAAVRMQAARGTHFGAPTEDAVLVAEELAAPSHCRTGASNMRPFLEAWIYGEQARRCRAPRPRECRRLSRRASSRAAGGTRKLLAHGHRHR